MSKNFPQKEQLYNVCNEVPKFQITIGRLITSFYFKCMSFVLTTLRVKYWHKTDETIFFLMKE